MRAKMLFLCDLMLVLAMFVVSSEAFVLVPTHVPSKVETKKSQVEKNPLIVSLSDDFLQESSESTRERIQELVNDHPVLLFMKGNKLFPQCGFSNTAVQILNSYGIDFHTVDVLSDQNIRQGVKDFSQWPTIPQLYVGGEFIGGSDIMIEMYQSGELGEMIEKVKAEMI